jgi:glycosyltransferase involved in cell wall biosynthesis
MPEESPLDLTVVIMTLNEQIHLERCLGSLKPLAGKFVIVDSGSSDRTIEIAQSFGAHVLHNPFVNHARQLNWALVNGNFDTKWTMRVDADEWFPSKTIEQIKRVVTAATNQESAFELLRYTTFLGRPIKHGGLSPQWLLRVWRSGMASAEERWMDEHIILNGDGKIEKIDAAFYDENLNNVGWWIDKHNKYANREVFDIFKGRNTSVAPHKHNNDARFRRFAKERIYQNLPLGLRPLLYIIYRLIFKLGFLDGGRGLMFHLMQGFWYRLLIDLKVMEINLYCKKKGILPHEAIQQIYGINIFE